MLIKEFRVVLPMSVDEYRVAQLWSVAEASKNETGGGEGIEVKENRPFDEKEKEEYERDGQYTHKIYHLASRVPKYIKVLAPKGSLEFHEKAWNAYPYCRTVVTNPKYMKDGFILKIETWHIADLGTSNNPHKRPKKECEKTEIVKIDIANDPIDSGDYKEEFDPQKFKSKKANRGPLDKNWMGALANQQNGDCKEGHKPYMCAYKLVTCNFKWWGLQNRVESMIQKQERRLFTTFHRQVFCWMDNWYGLTMDDIRELEDKTKKELDEMRRKGSIKGMVVKDEN